MLTSVHLPVEIEARLDRLAAATGQSKAALIRELVAVGLDQLETKYSLVLKAADIRAGRRTTISAADVRHELLGPGT